MKKVFIALTALALTFSTFSCRETTEDKMENDMEEAGNDIENAAERAGNDIEAAAEETGEDIENAANNAAEEMEEEVEGTDDGNMDDDA